MLLVLQSGCHSWWSSNLSLRRFITKSDTGALASASTKSQSFIHSGTRRSNPTGTYRNLSYPRVLQPEQDLATTYFVTSSPLKFQTATPCPLNVRKSWFSYKKMKAEGVMKDVLLTCVTREFRTCTRRRGRRQACVRWRRGEGSFRGQ